MQNKKAIFSKIEKHKAPATILFRGIELKLLKEKLIPLLKTKTVLDLGCGEGVTGSVLFDKKIDYGVDNDPVAVRKARKQNIYKKVLLTNATKIPLEDQTVDLVVSNCTLEHIKDLDSVLEEIKRILAKEGLFIFTTPSHRFKDSSIFNLSGLRVLTKIYGRLRDKKLNHYHCHSLKKWLSILKQSDFKLIDGYYYLDQPTARLWDFLFILNPLFRILTVISQELMNWVYKKFLKELIHKRYLKAKFLGSQGAAVCLIAQKLNK